MRTLPTDKKKSMWSTDSNKKHEINTKKKREKKKFKEIISIMTIIKKRREEWKDRYFGSWYQAIHTSACASTLIKATCLKLRDIIRRLNVSLLRHLRTAPTIFESVLYFFHLMKIRKKLRYLATIDVIFFSVFQLPLSWDLNPRSEYSKNLTFSREFSF